MSVLFGIKPHGQKMGIKKGRALRVPRAKSAINKSETRLCVRSRAQLMDERMIFSPNRLHFGGSCAGARLPSRAGGL
jgi:hypothetical protein